MIDDFLIRALLAGIGLAIIAGPLGCFVVWRGMAYFGDTMAHSALLGVALALAFQTEILLGVFAVCLLVAFAMLLLQARSKGTGQKFSTDALLGILSHSALALGLVVVSMMSWIKVDVMGLLIGDVLAVSNQDLVLIFGGGALVLVCLAVFWRQLLISTVSEEIADAEAFQPRRAELVLMVLLAITIAIAIKIVGILLITALLIIPAASARRLASSPEQMAMAAIGFGIVAVAGGLFGSLQFDTPSGPSIVVTAMVVFLTTQLLPQRGVK